MLFRGIAVCRPHVDKRPFDRPEGHSTATAKRSEQAAYPVPHGDKRYSIDEILQNGE